MAIGTDQHSGEIISGVNELQQRIGRVLRTPKGSLLQNRHYGSDLPEKIDRNYDPLAIIYSCTEAFTNPANDLTDFALDRVNPTNHDGHTLIIISGVFEDNPITLEPISLGVNNE